MKKPTTQQLGRSVLMILLLLTFFNTYAQQTLTTINGWNAYVHLPDDYNTTGSQTYPVIIFFPGTGEVGTNASLVLNYGPGHFIASGWNGNVVVNGVTVKPIIISLQPPGLWPRVADVDVRIQTIKSMYRIDPNRITLTGLSMGGWVSEMYVESFPTAVASVVALQAVRPDDNPAYPAPFATYALDCGHWLGYEQVNDPRDMSTIYNTMTAAKAGSATYFLTNVGGGGHCCWNTWYDPTHTDNYSLNGVTGNWSIYQYMLTWNRCTGTAPVANAGSDTTVLIPAIVNLNGTRSSDADGTIISYAWSKVSGPAQLTMTNANSSIATVSNLASGTYQFQLKVTDNLGMSSTASVSVTGVGIVLATDFVSFSGSNSTEGNYLQWQVTGSVDAGNFTLERSDNGKDFSPIGSIPEQTGQGSYSFVDGNVQSSAYYYRVKHVSKAGDVKYSGIIEITKADEGPLFKYYPNPVKDYVVVQASSKERGQVGINVISMDGRIVFRQQWYKNDDAWVKQINLAGIPQGQYVMTVYINGKIHNLAKIVHD